MLQFNCFNKITSYGKDFLAAGILKVNDCYFYFNIHMQFHRPKKKDERDKKASTLPGVSEGIAGMAMDTMNQWEVNEMFEKMLVCRSFKFVVKV